MTDPKQPTQIHGRGRYLVRPGWRLFLPETPAPENGLPLVVALHGQGQSGEHLAGVLAPLCRGPRAVLIPDGPLPLEVDRDGGRILGFAWYLYTGDQEAFLESAGQSEDYLWGLIERTVAAAPIDPTRIFLLGYSQGGYLAGIMALHRPGRVSGLISVCSRIKSEILEDDAPAKTCPVLVVHGKRDRHLPVERARESAEVLRERGWEVEVREFESGHRFSEEQVGEVGRWLGER